MKFERFENLTTELSANLVKSIVLPGGLLEWLSKPLAERLRAKIKPVAAAKAGSLVDSSEAWIAGRLLLLGGSPVPDEAIVAMIHLAGGRSAKLAVIPVATNEHQQAAEEAVRLFTRFGMRNVHVLELVTRERADSPEWASKLGEFDAVILCGEDPAIGLNVLRATACTQELRKMMLAGKPVAGLNAGATILGDRLVVEQDGRESLAEGLGFASGMLVETGFSQESRFGRLVKAMDGALMGVGLEAGAALIIRSGEARVLGEASVTFLDPRESTPMAEPASSQPGSMCGLKVHVLMDGYGMSLRTRRPVGPNRDAPQVVNDR